VQATKWGKGDEAVTSQGERDIADTDRDEGQASDAPSERKDVSPEMSKLLNARRWETRQEPFRGFGSPPGRF
jgi:hypothetical protein